MIMHGAARGADRIAGEEAEKLGLPTRSFPANWAGEGRPAGHDRNSKMLAQLPDLVIAFHSDLGRSRGTRDTVWKARTQGIPFEVIGHEDDRG